MALSPDSIFGKSCPRQSYPIGCHRPSGTQQLPEGRAQAKPHRLYVMGQRSPPAVALYENRQSLFGGGLCNALHIDTPANSGSGVEEERSRTADHRAETVRKRPCSAKAAILVLSVEDEVTRLTSRKN